MREATTRVLADVAAERTRQIEDGWTPEHDDTHEGGELAQAAAALALPPKAFHYSRLSFWPWDKWMSGGARRDELVKAAALIVAEIERLDRAEVLHA